MKLNKQNWNILKIKGTEVIRDQIVAQLEDDIVGVENNDLESLVNDDVGLPAYFNEVLAEFQQFGSVYQVGAKTTDASRAGASWQAGSGSGSCSGNSSGTRSWPTAIRGTSRESDRKGKETKKCGKLS